MEQASENGNNQMTGGHDEGSGDEDGLATHIIDPDDGRDRRKEHDNTDDTSREQGKRVASEAEVLEDGRCVVKNGVDTSPLLEEHRQCTDGRTEEQGACGDKTKVVEKGELKVGGERAILPLRVLDSTCLFLEQLLGLDLPGDAVSIVSHTAEASTRTRTRSARHLSLGEGCEPG